MKNRELFTFIRHAVNHANGSDEMIDAALDFLQQLQYDYDTKQLDLEPEQEEETPEQEEEIPVNSVLRSGVDLNDLVRHNCSGSTYVYLRDCGLISADVHVLLDFLYGELSLGGVMLRDNFKEVQPLIDAIENEIFEESSPEEPESEQKESFSINISESIIKESIGKAFDASTTYMCENPNDENVRKFYDSLRPCKKKIVPEAHEQDIIIKYDSHNITVFCENSKLFYCLHDVECIISYDLESCCFEYKIYDNLFDKSWLFTVFSSVDSFSDSYGCLCITSDSRYFLESFNFFSVNNRVSSYSSDLSDFVS